LAVADHLDLVNALVIEANEVWIFGHCGMRYG